LSTVRNDTLESWRATTIVAFLVANSIVALEVSLASAATSDRNTFSIKTLKARIAIQIFMATVSSDSVWHTDSVAIADVYADVSRWAIDARGAT